MEILITAVVAILIIGMLMRFRDRVEGDQAHHHDGYFYNSHDSGGSGKGGDLGGREAGFGHDGGGDGGGGDGGGGVGGG